MVTKKQILFRADSRSKAHEELFYHFLINTEYTSITD